MTAKKKPAFTLGSDPEVFARKGGQFTSLVGKVGGKKGNPVPLPHGGGVQEDNLALEFNTEPATSARDFVRYVTQARDDVHGIMIQNNCSLSPASVAKFAPLYLDCDAAKEFGCDPDFNAWTLEPNPVPDLHNSAVRTAGGHVHIGWNFKDDMERINMARLMDVFHGIPSVLMDKYGQSRRKYYGMAGAHRPKPYGIESRILSNYWIFNQGEINNIFRRAKLALKFLPRADELIERLDGERLITTINTGNRAHATDLWRTTEEFIGEAL